MTADDGTPARMVAGLDAQPGDAKQAGGLTDDEREFGMCACPRWPSKHMRSDGLGCPPARAAGPADDTAERALRDAADALDNDEEVAMNVILGGPSYVAYWLRERAAADTAHPAQEPTS